MSRWLFIAVLGVVAVAQAAETDRWAGERARLMNIVADQMQAYVDEPLSAGVKKAMLEVPRHEFVPDDEKSRSYVNRPVPIGYGQTISQPFIVALMTQMLEPAADHKVLEIGTGSGYQAAVLSPLVGQVYSIEIVEPLGLSARERLTELGYDNVTTTIGDGYYGWEKHAPFDSIIVTAAASHIPPPLVRQLKTGGRMVIPVGRAFYVQHLMYVEKLADGSIRTEQRLPVQFVPLTGGH